jgi:pyruvate-ferredoxin/flavodoxin oxidoreductase
MARWECVDGNEAAALIAYALSEVIAIYPITPASSMGELADAWASARKANVFGTVPTVVEMQSEAGAAGALHGALQKGALGTTFTSSQGLLLMLPNMFKIAGELTPAVIHVAARAIATHALSIFGDHSDVMAARTTGFALLASSSVQEAHDLALVSHLATLRSRVPFLHFFDGFRTSHEVDKIQVLDDEDIRALVDESLVAAHRARGLTPDAPVLRGSAQNPDVFFQAREAANPYYEALPGIVQDEMDRLFAATGRRYSLVEYHGAPDAERVLVVMGSGAGAAIEAVDELGARGEKVGVVVVRLYRPFPAEAFVDALPTSVRSVVVLDRVKEPGAVGEPLYTDVVAALVESGRPVPATIGGRYGLASKEFTPAMAAAALAEPLAARPIRHFTVGIVDDVTHRSLAIDRDFVTDRAPVRAVFYGLGSDGTVGANKTSVKIVGEHTDLYAQGYFVYDSKKSGSTTISHLRFSPSPITSTYLVQEADFVACHQFALLERLDVLGVAKTGATVLLNSPYAPDDVWAHLPAEVQQQIVDKSVDLWVIDAHRVARDVGLPGRINSVMQPAFFELSGILPADDAIAALKTAVTKTYAKRGPEVVARNIDAIDRSLDALHRVDVSAAVVGAGGLARRPAVPDGAPSFVERVTSVMMAGEGDLLPVSALPVDGTFPTDTARWERRAIAQEIPQWDESICIDCGKCAIVCPHAAIRMKVFKGPAPEGLKSKAFRSKDLPGHLLTIQVAPDDCTGCGICVDVCPAKSKTDPTHKSLDLVDALSARDEERQRWELFQTVPSLDRAALAHDSVKSSQVLEPLFEFSGACSGCGETPYLKLLSQLFGDRLLVANATGCSSIYGGNLPTTPWSVDGDGRGPAWANSLFEDNAEFGLGLRVAADVQRDLARSLVEQLRAVVGDELADAILSADQSTEEGIAAQRERVAALKTVLAGLNGSANAASRRLLTLADELVERSLWIVGGDGWAYDIGFGGLDHVLASGRNVNVLVLDTEVYSNTGGQASKSTPLGAVAKFAAAGKRTPKKDLGSFAMAYGHVYVAQIALGANDVQTVKALLEAEAWPGPSLVVAYSTCIAHGIEMSTSMSHQKDAVRSGYWPLYRYDPSATLRGEAPFRLDSHAPSMPVRDFALAETRFSQLVRARPEAAEHLLAEAQDDVDARWRRLEALATANTPRP